VELKPDVKLKFLKNGRVEFTANGKTWTASTTISERDRIVKLTFSRLSDIDTFWEMNNWRNAVVAGEMNFETFADCKIEILTHFPEGRSKLVLQLNERVRCVDRDGRSFIILRQSDGTALEFLVSEESYSRGVLTVTLGNTHANWFNYMHRHSDLTPGMTAYENIEIGGISANTVKERSIYISFENDPADYCEFPLNSTIEFIRSNSGEIRQIKVSTEGGTVYVDVESCREPCLYRFVGRDSAIFFTLKDCDRRRLETIGVRSYRTVHEATVDQVMGRLDNYTGDISQQCLYDLRVRIQQAHENGAQIIFDNSLLREELRIVSNRDITQERLRLQENPLPHDFGENGDFMTTLEGLGIAGGPLIHDMPRDILTLLIGGNGLDPAVINPSFQHVQPGDPRGAKNLFFARLRECCRSQEIFLRAATGLLSMSYTQGYADWQFIPSAIPLPNGRVDPTNFHRDILAIEDDGSVIIDAIHIACHEEDLRAGTPFNFIHVRRKVSPNGSVEILEACRCSALQPSQTETTIQFF
jgi:hypothetical protein